MSVPTTVLNTVPPQEQLGQLVYRRDELLKAAQRNRVATQQRANELMTWMAEGQIAEDYDIDSDHRIAALTTGAEAWETEAAQTQDKIDRLNAQIGALTRPVRAPVRGRAGGRRTKGEADG